MIVALQNGDVEPGLPQPPSSGQAGDPRTDHDHPPPDSVSAAFFGGNHLRVTCRWSMWWHSRLPSGALP
ncbi:hypothetical protein [Streptomyces sp. NBC_01017]|uniref:hypothetical protein n=1 Tax=Streptomyces sp. NBC_01017 TaxID=2903721 RepID=UPI00386BCB0F